MRTGSAAGHPGVPEPASPPLPASVLRPPAPPAPTAPPIPTVPPTAHSSASADHSPGGRNAPSTGYSARSNHPACAEDSAGALVLGKWSGSTRGQRYKGYPPSSQQNPPWTRTPVGFLLKLVHGIPPTGDERRGDELGSDVRFGEVLLVHRSPRASWQVGKPWTNGFSTTSERNTNGDLPPGSVERQCIRARGPNSPCRRVRGQEVCLRRRAPSEAMPLPWAAMNRKTKQ